jgi:hypothetical protein
MLLRGLHLISNLFLLTGVSLTFILILEALGINYWKDISRRREKEAKKRVSTERSFIIMFYSS